MKLLILHTTVAFLFTWTTTSAHRDRIEKPKTYKFTFLDGQTITLDNTNTYSLTSHCNDIVKGNRKLVRAELTFNTGEILTFVGNGDKWTKIQISDGRREYMVPELTTKRIPVVDFATIALCWDGRDKNAFDASYFYIEFEIGPKKLFAKYFLSLIFSGNEFSKATVSRKTRNSEQSADF